jgi:hypothetical protein
MSIIGGGLYARFQRIAMLDTRTGELHERRLEHFAATCFSRSPATVRPREC